MLPRASPRHNICTAKFISYHSVRIIMISYRKIIYIFAFSLLYPSIASAVESYYITPAEMAKLPRYCYLKQVYGEDKNHPEEQAIYDMLGVDYVHMHHYCWGLNYANRADSDWNDKVARSYRLQLAANNFNYVLAAATPGFFMRPEIHLQLGKVLLRAGKSAEAAQNFQKAIQIKPDYVPAYLALSDYYKQIGSPAKALSLLEDGLKQVPSSPSLARLYRKLGGKGPLPEVSPPVAETTQPQTQPPAPVETEKKAVGAADVTAPETSKPEPASPSEKPAEKIGSPSNPWCRFCTDDEVAPAGK